MTDFEKRLAEPYEPFERETVISGSKLEAIIHKGLLQITQHGGPCETRCICAWDTFHIDDATARWLIEVLEAALLTCDLNDGEDGS